jgi:SOS-response transcriptional repressor LexA
MSKTITYRFKKCHDALIEKGLIKNSSHLASTLDVHRQFLSRVLNGLSDVTLDMLGLITEQFPINPNYLLKGEGDIFLRSNSETTKVTYVPRVAHAGYLEQNQEIVFLDSLSVFSLPSDLFSDEEYRCFEIKGESMEPIFFEKELVLCTVVSMRYMDRVLRKDQFYIVITKDDILLKRVENNLATTKELRLLSENDFYPPIDLKADDIIELWKVEAKITTRLNHSTANSTLLDHYSKSATSITA